MASIRKVKDKWLAEVRIKGKYRSKTFGTKGEAKGWADDEERKINKSGDIIYGKTLGDAFRKYIDEESPKKKGARWEIIRLEKIGRDEIASVQLVDLTADDFEKWIKRQDGLSDSSIRRELQCISPVLTKCHKWKWMDHYPLKDVEMPKKSKPRDKIYSDEQISRVLVVLDYTGEVTTQRHKIAVAFLLAIETAMRQGEMWNLTWEHVHVDRRHVHLPDTKNGTSRDVPLSLRAVQLLQSLAPASGRVFNFSQASAGVIFKRALSMAGIEGMTWHDLRHSAITRLARKLDMLDLARMTGHKDPRQLMIYFNPSPHDIAQRLD